MSKREQAAQEFVRQVNSRTRTALVDYFVSHGVWVEDHHLGTALKLEEYRSFLNTLAKDLNVTSKATRLASDIGSISLAEKEKAMKSVYEVEAMCKESAGDRSELHAHSGSLHRLVAAWPSSPTLGGPFAVGVLGSFLIFIGQMAFGALAIVAAAGYGLVKITSFERHRKALREQIANANAQFEGLLSHEITPRPEVSAAKDWTRSKGYAFAGIVGLAAITGFLMHARSSEHENPALQTAAQDVSHAQLASSAAPDVKGETESNPLAWLVGKYPSEVVNDKRFRAAFNRVSKSDWKKISDRLAVTNGLIQVKDGFLSGAGCMAHRCGSDQAAFAIDAATGKGTVAYQDSGGSEPAVKAFAWPEKPLSDTPIAQSARDHNGASDFSKVSTSPAQVMYKASFDCSKARSDAEQLICGDAELAAADVELATVYAQAKAAVSDQAAFRDRTRAQWNYREQKCHDRVCLQRWYVDQKIALGQIAKTGRLDEQ